jgi:hypothetical protein
MAAFRQIPGSLTPALAGAGSNAAELPRGSEQAQRAGLLKKEIGEKIKAEPAASSQLVQTWIRDGKPK